MKLRHPKIYLLGTIILIGFVCLVIYLTSALPPPKVSLELTGSQPEITKVFHMKLATNDTNSIYFEDDTGWFRELTSSTNFPREQTNALCSFYLTNQGPARIWWDSMGCEVVARTAQGWITNWYGNRLTISWSVGPEKINSFHVYVPKEALEWRVAGRYFYVTRHAPGAEFMGWLMDDLHKKGTNTAPALGFFVLPVLWIMALDPDPAPIPSEIHSQTFTNLP